MWLDNNVNENKEWVNCVQEYVLSLGYDGPLRTIYRKDSILLFFKKGNQRYWLKIYFSAIKRFAESEANVLNYLYNAGCSVPCPVFGKTLYFRGAEGGALLMNEVRGAKLVDGSSIDLEELISEIWRIHKNMKHISFSDISLPPRDFLSKKDEKIFSRLGMSSKLGLLRTKYNYMRKQLIHGDIYEDNIFFDGTGVSIIDFSDMKIGIVEEDIADVVRCVIKYRDYSVEGVMNFIRYYYKDIDAEDILTIAIYNEAIFGSENRAKKLSMEKI